MNALPFGGLDWAGQDTMSDEAVIRSGAETDFAEDDHFTQRLFRLIVSLRDIRGTEESQKIFLFRPQEISSERFGGLKTGFKDIFKLVIKIISRKR